MASVHDVASKILMDCDAISTMKFQKLAYYAQAWHLVWDEEPLFTESIEAWAAGPVVPSLYQKHRGRYSVDSWEWGDPTQLTETERGTVEEVVGSYGRLNGRQLSHLTHNERPWLDARSGLPPGARSNAVIDLDSMADYYSAIDEDEMSVPVLDLLDSVPGGDGKPT